MNKSIVAAILSIAAIAVFSSCGQNKKKETKPEAATLSVAPEGAVVFSSNGQKVTIGSEVTEPVFTVTTNQSDWSATSNKEWLNVKMDKASNKFTLSAKPNSDVSSLPTASVTVVVNDTLRSVIPVSQLSFGIENAELAHAALVVGRGYDVTGSYAQANEIKAAVLDFAELHNNNLVKRNTNYREGRSSTYASENVNEVARKLETAAGISTKAGVSGICSFQQEFKTSFGMERIEKNYYAVAVTKHNIVRDAYFVDYTDISKLSQYVTPSFLEDLANMPADTIITLYGTHVMLGGVWGARVDQNISVRKTARGFNQSAGMAISARAEGTIKGITAGGGSNLEVNREYKEYFHHNEEKMDTHVLGGDPEFVVNIHNANDYEKWVNSVAGNEIWCNYYPNTLVPIYELVGNEKDKQLLHAAFDKYLAGKAINVTNVLVNGKLQGKATVKGGAAHIGGGDKDIHSKSGRKTNYVVKIELRENQAQNAIDVAYDYTVEENSSNNTKLQIVATDQIHVGKPDFTLTEKVKSWIIKGSIGGENHRWTSIDTNGCPFLKSLSIRVDGDGDDQNNIGVEGTFNISYSYIE